MRSNTVYSEEKENYITFRVIEEKRIITLKEKIIQKIIGILSLLLGIGEIVAGYKGMIDEGGLFLIMIPLGIGLVVSNK